MTRKKMIELTNMCMITNDLGQVLVEDRINPNWPGITFPGGHVKSGESLSDSIIREVKEETGLTILNPRLCGIKNWMEEDGRYLVLLYRSDTFSGEIKSSIEGRVFWLDPNLLPQQNLAGNDFMTMYELFTNSDLSEMFYDNENITRLF